MQFWNTVWLILVSHTRPPCADCQNDLVLGYCAAGLLKQYGPMLSSVIPDMFQVRRLRSFTRFCAYM